MGEQLTGSQILCRALLEEGVDVLFGYPGGAIMPFYHALPEYPELRHVLVRHEQAAAHAADGYARASGRPGVCVATSGPGATNLVTGIATAHMDNTPLVAITGQVPRAMIGRDAFQETDIIGITQPITKHNRLVEDVEELADAVHEVFAVAREGRPGPVLLDVPKDVQNQKLEYAGGSNGSARGATGRREGLIGQPTPTALVEAARLIARAERPLIMAGHGVILSDAYDELRTLAERTGVPVITTLLGISAFPEAHPLHLGMPGMHGEVHVNRAIQQADLIIGVGLRFDDRVTGNLAAFARGAKVIHIELDASEIGKNVPVAVGLVGDARAILRELLEALEPRHCDGWRAEIESFVRPRFESFKGGLSAEGILAALEDASQGPLHGRLRRGPAPDVGGQAVPLSAAQHPHHLGRARHHGLRRAGRHGRGDGPTRRAGLGHLGRRRLPDEHAGDRHDGAGADPGEDGDLQQRVPGHGAAVAAVLPRPPLLLDADLEPRLRASGRGLRHPRVARRAGRPGGRRPARRARSRGAGADRVPHRAGGERVPDDPAGRVAQRADRVRGGHRMMLTRAVTVLLEDRLITFTRAVGLLRRRNLPVRSLAVGPTVTPGVSRLTIMIQSDEATADRAVQQLQKVVGVRAAAAFPAREGVSRELALVKVRASGERYGELLDVVQLYHASVVDDSPEAIIVELTGSEAFVLSCIRALERFEVLEVARSGAVALELGLTDAGARVPANT